MRISYDLAEKIHQAVLEHAAEIVKAKRVDYSGYDDPFANFRASYVAGVEPWRGAIVRLLDKVSRMVRLAEGGGTGQVKEESLLDTVADLVNYAVIAFSLILETVDDEVRNRLLTRMGIEGE